MCVCAAIVRICVCSDCVYMCVCSIVRICVRSDCVYMCVCVATDVRRHATRSLASDRVGQNGAAE